VNIAKRVCDLAPQDKSLSPKPCAVQSSAPTSNSTTQANTPSKASPEPGTSTPHKP